MNQLLVFAKAPRIGLVKSRLAELIGQERACRAYELLLTTLARNLASVQNVTVYHSPPDGAADLRNYFPRHWNYLQQYGVDLGTRLNHAVIQTFEAGASRVCVIGSDCPYLTADDISASWTLLSDHDVVLGPAADGGYWLIALKKPEPRLFEAIAWSTSAVLQQTIIRARELNLSIALLRELSDIDTAADWLAFTQPSAAHSGTVGSPPENLCTPSLPS